MTTHFKLPSATVAIVAAALIGLSAPSPAAADHAAGGTCKHSGGLFSLCKGGARNKKCTIDGKAGKCVQKAAGCQCESGRAAVIDGAVTDLREAFDVVLTSGDLSPAVVPPPLACQQVTTVMAHMANAVPFLNDFAGDPEFISTAFLGQIDSLLRDVPQVEAVAAGCAENLPPGLVGGLLAIKTSYLSTFADLLD